jgi:hypothetical protein
MKIVLSSILIFMIACGNANAQDYLAAGYSTPGDGTCSGKISVFHYAVGGKCFTTDGTTSRKITLSSKLKEERYSSLDCSGTTTSTGEGELKCTAITNTRTNVTTSTSASSASSMPVGNWLVTRIYKSSSCTDVQMLSGMDASCQKVGTTASAQIKEDAGSFYQFGYANTDCSGTGTKGSSSFKAGECVPYVGGTNMYVKYSIETVADVLSSSSVASFNAFMVFALVIMSIMLQ